MKKISVLTLLLISIQSFSQEKNYFFEIEDFQDNYSENAVVSRFLHSVGFRYYWATEGLNENDLKYKPSDTGISTRATLEHIYTLAIIINSGIKDIKVERSESYPELSYKELRENTLKLTKESIDLILKYSEDDFNSSKVRFGDQGYDFYNLFHGPISDSLYHIGQVVSYRRSSGNPIPRGVNHFLGKKM
ncbi:MAG: hypothetical protein CMB81_04210 [Flammeovirgaceae bacterium]|jgi:hypothetical protein|nr:hypothetical protein [Flammeovirgaceae bacterium]|tara:strand:- start:278 stop:847 length:570 start_codon:yes stop_codon:yes gene_type:complete